MVREKVHTFLNDSSSSNVPYSGCGNTVHVPRAEEICSALEVLFRGGILDYDGIYNRRVCKRHIFLLRCGCRWGIGYDEKREIQGNAGGYTHAMKRIRCD